MRQQSLDEGVELILKKTGLHRQVITGISKIWAEHEHVHVVVSYVTILSQIQSTYRVSYPMDFGLNKVFLFTNIFFNITHERTQILLEGISHEVQEL